VLPSTSTDQVVPLSAATFVFFIFFGGGGGPLFVWGFAFSLL
jgi:hypothetical protein